MILKGSTVSLIFHKSSHRPERKTLVDGKIVSQVVPFLEIGVDHKAKCRLYYIGVWKFFLAIAVNMANYKPIWEKKEEPLAAGVLEFRKIKRKKRHVADSTKLVSKQSVV